MNKLTQEGCPHCENPGDSIMKGNGTCARCHGTGNETLLDDIMDAVTPGEYPDCRDCGGSGTCSHCNGSGWI